jgi:hypothetical protein
MVETTFKHGSTTVGLRKRQDPSRTKPEFVRVRASEEKYRKALKHGVSGKRFLPDINESVEWPNDVYTHRRLREGSVVLDESSKPQAKERAPVRKTESV